MTTDLRGQLERRAPGQWELYAKTAETREIDTARGTRRAAWRREEGWAARWWEAGTPRFAAGSNPAALESAIAEAARLPGIAEETPAWPSHRLPPAAPDGLVDPPPELFDDLSRAVSAASRGEALVDALRLRQGRAEERIVNGAGLDVTQRHRLCDGVALVIGRRGGRAREVRMPFRWSAAAPELEALARRLADAAVLALGDRPPPFSHGQWLLDPGVAAALLSALAPLFTRERPPRWITRGRLAAPAVSVADDATGDAAYDGEGVGTRRMLLIEDGETVARLHDLRTARRAGRLSTGHGVRPSFRQPPGVGPRRLFFESRSPTAPAALLSSVTRGLFAAALTAPVRVDLEENRYEIEFTGVSLAAGRAQGPVAGARATGRISELLRRITALSTDLQFFSMPFPAGAPTLLVERANFE